MPATPRATETPALRIPLPADDQAPLKVNVFEQMQSSNVQLLPLFPYLGPGAIVPCGAIFRGGGSGGFASVGEDDDQFGLFFHDNDVDEVVFTWASDRGSAGCGHVRVTPNFHGVFARVPDAKSPDSYLILTITQRQVTSGAQTERVLFRCSKCHETLTRREYEGLPPEHRPDHAGTGDRYPAMPTIAGTAAAALEYNSSEPRRTCPKCGTVNAHFPAERWGWDTYLAQSRVGNAGRRALDAAAAEVAG